MQSRPSLHQLLSPADASTSFRELILSAAGTPGLVCANVIGWDHAAILRELMAEFKIGNCAITVVLGDITQIEADAIVNPANSRLMMGGGVAGAIKRVGGPIIQREAIRKAPIRVGEAVVTSAGELRARYVIHAPTMPLPAMSTDLSNVEKATTAALKLARGLGLSSIAIPGMGTGVGRVPAKDAARSMVEAIKQHLSEGTTLRRIALVSIDDELIGAFESVLR